MATKPTGAQRIKRARQAAKTLPALGRVSLRRVKPSASKPSKFAAARLPQLLAAARAIAPRRKAG